MRVARGEGARRVRCPGTIGQLDAKHTLFERLVVDGRLSEELLFRAIGQQRKIVEQARKQTRSVKAARSQQIPVPAPAPPEAAGGESPGVDYSKPAEPYKVEIWE